MKPNRTKKAKKVRKFAVGGDMRGSNASPVPPIGATGGGSGPIRPGQIGLGQSPVRGLDGMMGDGIQRSITDIENDAGAVGQQSMMADAKLGGIQAKIGTPGSTKQYAGGGAVKKKPAKKAAKKPSRPVKKFAVGGDMRLPDFIRPAPLQPIAPTFPSPGPTTPRPKPLRPIAPTFPSPGDDTVRGQMGTIGKISNRIGDNAQTARTGLSDIQKDIGGGRADIGGLFTEGGAVKKSAKKPTNKSTRATTKKPPQKSSGKVRGAGIAQRGVRKAKMR